MKRTISVLITTAVLLASTGTTIAVTAGSAAANPACMSRPEYRKVHVGQRLAQVKRIVGSNGRSTMSSRYLNIRQWNTCESAYGVATIGFVRGKVDSKSFFA